MAEETSPVSDRSAAERLVRDVTAAMDALGLALQEETAHLAAGRIRQGLADGAGKSRVAAEYLRGLEAVKANAVALKRHVPDLLPALSGAGATLRETALRNQAVIATARAVSEGLIKSVGEEVARAARPAGYGPVRAGAGGPPAAAAPLAFSGSF